MQSKHRDAVDLMIGNLKSSDMFGLDFARACKHREDLPEKHSQERIPFERERVDVSREEVNDISA